MARKGSRTRYTGAQAQQPGSRRKAQWGTPLKAGFGMREFPDPTTREPLYRPVRIGKRLQLSVEDYNKLEGKPKIVLVKENKVTINDRRKARAKPERRKGERRKEQTGKLGKTGISMGNLYVAMSERDFKRLNAPKPKPFDNAEEPGLISFEERRYHTDRRGRVERTRRKTDKR